MLIADRCAVSIHYTLTDVEEVLHGHVHGAAGHTH